MGGTWARFGGLCPPGRNIEPPLAVTQYVQVCVVYLDWVAWIWRRGFCRRWPWSRSWESQCQWPGCRWRNRWRHCMASSSPSLQPVNVITDVISDVINTDAMITSSPTSTILSTWHYLLAGVRLFSRKLNVPNKLVRNCLNIFLFNRFSCRKFLSISQEIGWEKRVQNDVFSVEWDVNPLMHKVAKMVT